MDKKPLILIVDDAELNRSILVDILSSEYRTIEAEDGEKAIEVLKAHDDISLILLDIVMPKMDGYEFLTYLNKTGVISDIPVIMISAESSSIAMDHAYDLGAVEFINRPFDFKTIQHRVHNTIILYKKQKDLESMLTQQILEKERHSFEMVEILSHIVEFRNNESGMHVLHIKKITEGLLKALVKKGKHKLSSYEIYLISNASALHDIGKISIPDEIINKPGKLTYDEFEIMKTHTTYGAQMLEKLISKDRELVKTAYEICRWHHEKYDGKGYPDGLVGDEIPLSAQVVSIADVYDALTSERVYKAAYTHDEAIAMILRGECGQFNPELIECLLEISDYLKSQLYLQSNDSLTRNQTLESARNLIKGGMASNRTISLLEQERIKYQFFAQMSDDIQFELDYFSKNLTISEMGVKKLGLPSLVNKPEESEILNGVFDPLDYQDLKLQLKQATPENPIVTKCCLLTVNNIQRWYRIFVRPLWSNEEENIRIGSIGKVIDVHEEQIEHQELVKQATHDSLTNLYNRNYMEALITSIITKNPDKKYAIIFFDVDDFKLANDTYGHLFGDSVLKFIASNLVSFKREADIACRIGGDEFMLFVEYKDKDRLIDNIKELFKTVSGRNYFNFTVHISLGISLFPEDGKTFNQLVIAADKALYTSKAHGKNNFNFYNKETMEDALSDFEVMIDTVESK